MLDVLVATGIPVEKEPVRARRRIAEAALQVKCEFQSFPLKTKSSGAAIRQVPTMMSAVAILFCSLRRAMW